MRGTLPNRSSLEKERKRENTVGRQFSSKKIDDNHHNASRVQPTPEMTKEVVEESFESNQDSGFLSGSSFQSDSIRSKDIDDLCIDSSKDIVTASATKNLSISVHSKSTHHQKSVFSTHIDIKKTVHDHESNKNALLDAYKQDDDGDTILHLAVVGGVLDIVNHLIKLAPNSSFLDFYNNLWQTPLHLAVLTHRPVIVRRLVTSGSSLCVRDRNGNTPLHLACALADYDCVKQLTMPLRFSEFKDRLASSPDFLQNLNLKNYEGLSCMHLATLAADVNIIDHLASYGADVNAQEGKSGWTPLHYSVEARNTKITRFLLEKCGADPTVRSYGGLTVFNQAKLLLHSSDGKSYRKTFEVLCRFSRYFDDSSTSEGESDVDCDGMKDDTKKYADLTINGNLVYKYY